MHKGQLGWPWPQRRARGDPKPEPVSGVWVCRQGVCDEPAVARSAPPRHAHLVGPEELKLPCPAATTEAPDADGWDHLHGNAQLTLRGRGEGALQGARHALPDLVRAVYPGSAGGRGPDGDPDGNVLSDRLRARVAVSARTALPNLRAASERVLPDWRSRSVAALLASAWRVISLSCMDRSMLLLPQFRQGNRSSLCSSGLLMRTVATRLPQDRQTTSRVHSILTFGLLWSMGSALPVLRHRPDRGLAAGDPSQALPAAVAEHHGPSAERAVADLLAEQRGEQHDERVLLSQGAARHLHRGQLTTWAT